MTASTFADTAATPAPHIASLALPGRSLAARNDQLNILCWEGYNSDDVLNPSRERHPGATVRAESGTSDPEMITRLRRRAGSPSGI